MTSKTRRLALLASGTLSFVWASVGTANVVISAKPTQNMTCAGSECSPTAKRAVLNVGELATMLAAGDVHVESNKGAKDIEIAAALSWTSTNTLTLDAYRSITFSKPVVVAGTGGLTIKTNDGGTGGDFRFLKHGHVEFWDTASSLTINGQGYALAKSIGEVARLAKRSEFVALAKSINVSKRTYTSSPINFLKTTLEGLGNTISNFTIVDSGDVCVGLIGCTDPSESMVVRDLRLEEVNVTGTGFRQSIGALAGANYGIIVNAYSTGQVSATNQNSAVGGLIGSTLGISAISRSYSTASVSGTGSGDIVGGFVGALGGPIDQSYAAGTVSGADNAVVGGFVGEQDSGIISNSYALGAVSGGQNASVGGFVGWNSSGSSLSDSYSLGSVTGGTGSTVGGFIGKDFTTSGLSDVYWNLDTSGISDPSKGAGNIANDTGITGLTTTQFQSGLPSGLVSSIWAEKPTVNDWYPYLVIIEGK